MARPSWSTFFATLSAVVVFAVPVVLYLMEKAGLALRAIFAVGWLSIALAGLYLVLNIPWVWAADVSLRMTMWRVCCVCSVTLLIVGYGAIRIWPPGEQSPLPSVPHENAVSIATPAKHHSLPSADRTTKEPKPLQQEELSPFLLYGNRRIELHNAGKTNITLWGFAYGDAQVAAGALKEPALIVPGTFYFIAADQLEYEVTKRLKNGEDAHLPCRAFITDSSNEKRTIECSLWIRKSNDSLTVETRILDIVSGWGPRSERANQ